MKEGWVCPRCGRVYGPMMMVCAYCNNREKTRDLDARVEEMCKNNPGTKEWIDFYNAINSPK